jgi:hypothetical protein
MKGRINNNKKFKVDTKSSTSENMIASDSTTFELNILFQQHIKESIEISNKIKTHKYFNQRELVLKWMYDICKEENCINNVFIQSANLFDKILIEFNETNILKIEYLQLFACACLLIISKLMFDDQENENRLTIPKLIFYTDNTYTIDELIDIEMLIIINLSSWNLNDYYNIYSESIEYFLKINKNLNIFKSLKNDFEKLNDLILNMFIFNNIFLLNHNQTTSDIFETCFLYSLISIKKHFQNNNIDCKFNKKIFKKIESSIDKNIDLYSFINNQSSNHDHGFVQEELEQEEDFDVENIIDTNELNSMFTIDTNSNSSSCSSGVYSSTSSLSSF